MRKKDEVFNAYNKLFTTYYKVLCANAYLYLKDEDEAKELVQAFYVEIWEKKSFLNWTGDAKAYMFKAIKNRCINKLRKIEVHNSSVSNYILGKEEDISDKKQEIEVLYLAVEDAFNELPFQRKEALTYVYLNNLPYKLAAQKMGISINSLKTHLKLGLKNLREITKKTISSEM